MSPDTQKPSFNLAQQGFSVAQAKTLLATNGGGASQNLSGIPLPAYSVYIGELTK